MNIQPEVQSEVSASFEPEELSLRDRFAMQVVTGCLVAGRHFDKEEMAAEAYEMADAMLQARDKEPE